MITEKDFLDKLNIILDRPGMFGIQKVEDVDIVFFSEIFLNSNKSIEEWSSKFREFVIKEVDNNLKNFGWSKVIRLYSGSDAHSLELFKDLYTRFTEMK